MATSRYRSTLLANIPQRLHSVLWIRIRPDPYLFWSAGSRRAKMTHKIQVLSAGCYLLRDEDFSCSLDVLYGGLGIS
jgi:hypothetical protein